ncbi:alpha/beta hydrolase family protein [Parasedimentitalea maritima]|uniref:Alpha/beta fold hydrolase n=1 Tax=Parasedimentitalea maritima TaxID=2578117 RepID=A0A6A4REY6_9RHOB|nr:alpha/beta hydrolase family protein [Zongyanglinia marina]KAE9631640.1 alpha/beta fold hydrolase [Zongyanglinia marina]
MIKTNRRAVLAGATAMLSTPFFVSRAKSSVNKKHVVLVHGAWHGAWAWQDTIPLLKQKDLTVSALDLSGLGTTAHLQAHEIGLHAHGQDILNHLFFFDIRDATVVAHSYGGGALSQALANDTEQRISHGIYLDAFRLGEGEAVADYQSAEVREGMRQALSSGAYIPARPQETWAEIWGMTGPAADHAAPRLRPMSPNCFLEKVEGDPFQGDRRLTYMRCMQNSNPVFKEFHEQSAQNSRFETAEVDGHHNVMVMDPPRMASAILEAV